MAHCHGDPEVSAALALCLHKTRRLQEAREVLEGVIYPLLPHSLTQRLMNARHQQLLVKKQKQGSLFDSQQETEASLKSTRREDRPLPPAAAEEIPQQPESQTETQTETSKANAAEEPLKSSGEQGLVSRDSVECLLSRMTDKQLDCLNMLCEIDAEEGQHLHTFLLLRFALGSASLSSVPLDLAVKLAAAGVITGEVRRTSRRVENGK